MKYLYFFLNCIAILSTLPAQSFGINMFIEHWLSEFQTDRITLSVIWLIASSISGIFVIFNGYILDKIGVKLSIRIVYPIYIVSVWLMSYAINIYQLAVLICLMRIFGPESIGTITFVSNCNLFNENRGKMFSIFSLLDWLFIAAPSLLNILITNNGWRNTYIYISTVVTAFLMPSIFFIRNVKKVVDESSETESKPFNWVIYLHLIFNNMVFALFWSGSNIHAVDYYSKLTTYEVANTIYLPIPFGLAIGSLCTGYYIDKLKDQYKIDLLAFAQFILSIIIFFSMFVIPRTAILFGLIYGIFVGIQITSYNVIYPCVFGTENLGKIQAFSNGLVMLCMGLGPTLFSMCKKYNGDYELCIQGITITLFVSSCILISKKL